MHGGQMLCKANFYKKQLADTTKAVIRLLRLIWSNGMDREEALAKLAECRRYDTESGHSVADEVLCDLLRSLGYDDVVDAWDRLPKWYA